MTCKTCGHPVVRMTSGEKAMPDEEGLYPGGYAHHQPGPHGGFLYPSRDGHPPDPDGGQ